MEMQVFVERIVEGDIYKSFLDVLKQQRLYSSMRYKSPNE